MHDHHSFMTEYRRQERERSLEKAVAWLIGAAGLTVGFFIGIIIANL